MVIPSKNKPNHVLHSLHKKSLSLLTLHFDLKTFYVLLWSPQFEMYFHCFKKIRKIVLKRLKTINMIQVRQKVQSNGIFESRNIFRMFEPYILFFVVVVFIFLTTLLQYNCFTMLCQFLLYNKVNQLYVYIYPYVPSLLRLPPTLPIPLLQVVTKH